MQRMLTGLVLFLTAVVGVLAVLVFQLQDQVDSQTRSRPVSGGARRVVDLPEETPKSIRMIEARVQALMDQIDSLRKEQQRTLTAISRAGGGAVSSDGPVNAAPGAPPTSYVPQLPSGDGITVTAEEEARYLAVKESVDRKRRIKAQVDNTMRRVDRLAQQGSIQPVGDQVRTKVEAALFKYTTAADDMVGRYFRNANEAVQSLTLEQRRDAIKKEKDEVAAAAQIELAAVLGEADAKVISDKLLTSIRRFERTPGEFGGDPRNRRGRGR